MDSNHTLTIKGKNLAARYVVLKLGSLIIDNNYINAQTNDPLFQINENSIIVTLPKQIKKDMDSPIIDLSSSLQIGRTPLKLIHKIITSYGAYRSTFSSKTFYFELNPSITNKTKINVGSSRKLTLKVWPKITPSDDVYLVIDDDIFPVDSNGFDPPVSKITENLSLNLQQGTHRCCVIINKIRSPVKEFVLQ